MHAEHPTVTRHPQHKAGGRGETHRVRSGERRSAVWSQNTNESESRVLADAYAPHPVFVFERVRRFTD